MRISLRTLCLGVVAMLAFASPAFAAIDTSPLHADPPNILAAAECSMLPDQGVPVLFMETATHCDQAILAVADVCLSVVPTNAPALVPSPNVFGAGHACQPFTDRSPPD